MSEDWTSWVKPQLDTIESLRNTVARLRANNEAIRHLLEPVKDFDWVGKWRVQRAIEMIEETVDV